MACKPSISRRQAAHNGIHRELGALSHCQVWTGQWLSTHTHTHTHTHTRTHAHSLAHTLTLTKHPPTCHYRVFSQAVCGSPVQPFGSYMHSLLQMLSWKKNKKINISQTSWTLVIAHHMLLPELPAHLDPFFLGSRNETSPCDWGKSVVHFAAGRFHA